MTKIHSTAIVDSAAKLGDNVCIGPYSVVGPEVEIGEGCEIASHCVLEGATIIGARNKIGIGTLIGAFPQDLAFDPNLRSFVRIGDDNVFREYVTIHRGTKEGSTTSLGSHNFIMCGCHFAHNVKMGSHCILANNTILGGYAEFADHVVTGGATVFHQFIRIGKYAMIRGAAGMGKDIPPYTVASFVNDLSGLNVVGLRRAGFSPAVRQEIARAYALVYRKGLNFSQAIQEAEKTEWGTEAQEFFDFIKNPSKKGICAPRKRTSREAEPE